MSVFAAAAAMVAGLLPAAGSDTSSPSSPVPLRRMVGTMVMGGFTGTRPSAELLRRVRGGRLGGVILFSENIRSAHQLRAMDARLQRAAHKGGSNGLLVSVDQEGGIVKRLPAAPPRMSPPEIGATGSARVAEHEGRATGAYLSRVGINLDLAPVMDVASPGSFITSRSFGNDRARVARLAPAFARGLGSAGVGATAKHFPGLGRAIMNTDTSGSVVSAPLGSLRRDELPFARAVAHHVPLVMVSTAVYPAFGTRLPAALSRKIVTGELRRRLGFDGVAITDDLEAASVRRVGSPGAAAVAAAKAGMDIHLVASAAGSRAVYEALLRAVRRGELPRAAVRASYDRIQALTRQVAAQP